MWENGVSHMAQCVAGNTLANVHAVHALVSLDGPSSHRPLLAVVAAAGAGADANKLPPLAASPAFSRATANIINAQVSLEQTRGQGDDDKMVVVAVQVDTAQRTSRQGLLGVPFSGCSVVFLDSRHMLLGCLGCLGFRELTITGFALLFRYRAIHGQ